MTALDEAMREASAAGIRFDRVPLRGLDYHYARAGSGFPLILLHGWPEFCLVWRPVMERLADRFDLIAPDLRGFGATGKASPEPDNAATADRHADDIAALADALGLEQFGVVGGDVGAFVATALGRKFEARVPGICFFSNAYPGIGARYGAPGHLIEVWYQYFQQLPMAAEVVGASREACHAYISHFLDHWSGDNPAVFAELREAIVDNFMRPGVLQGGFDWYVSSAPTRRLMLEGKLPPASPMAQPCHFVWGKRDPLIRAEWSDRLGEFFSNFTIEFVEAGHFVHYERPDLAADRIRAFFTKQY